MFFLGVLVVLLHRAIRGGAVRARVPVVADVPHIDVVKEVRLVSRLESARLLWAYHPVGHFQRVKEHRGRVKGLLSLLYFYYYCKIEKNTTQFWGVEAKEP